MKKNVVWIVVGTIVGVMLVASTVLLAVGIGNLAITQKRLDVLLATWRSFYQQNPFPAEHNIQRENENCKRFEQWYADIMATLRKRQRNPDSNKSPTNFKTVLDERVKAMIEKAGGKVKMPARFGCGFERYLITGNMPAPEDVPVLTQQLFILEDLFNILVDAGVSEIVSVGREVFETMPSSESGQRKRSGGRGAGAVTLPLDETATQAAPSVRPGEIVGDSLYGKLHFVLEFRAFEKALIDVMNRIASAGMVVVVTDVRIEAEGTELQRMIPTEKPKTGEQEERKPQPLTMTLSAKAERKEAEDKKAEKEIKTVETKEESGPPPRDQRIVSGQSKVQPMKVVMGVDAYVFRRD